MNDPLQDSILTTDDKQKSLIEEIKFDNLDTIKIYAYGVGHFFNDLLGALWFNFLFYFLKTIVKTQVATIALVVGQICDGIATPTIGILSDKYTSKKWGQRTPWYFFGVIIVFISFLPIWQGFQTQSNWQYVYYTVFPGLVNVGWAMVQISHMSLVPALTCSRKRRDKLNNLRNSFSFIANFTVLALGLVIFQLMNEPLLQYKIISYIVAIIGLSTSAFFLWHIKQVDSAKFCTEKAEILKQYFQEKKLSRQRQSSINIQAIQSGQQIEQKQEKNLQNLNQHQNQWKNQSILSWFRLPKFYLFCICYTGVRLYTNMFGTFLPFYLEGVLKLGLDVNNQHSLDDHIPFTVALVPLIVYLSSALSSMLLDKFYIHFGRKKALFTGTIVGVACFSCMYFISIETNYLMYVIGVFIGISQTMVLATGINFISDIIGTKSKKGAFVFGCYSLFDKFSAGLVIFLVGDSSAYSKQIYDLNDSERVFIKNTFIFIPLIACIVSAIIVLAYPIKEYVKKAKLEGQDQRQQIEQELVR